MLKQILNLDGAQEMSKNDLKLITGGKIPPGPCYITSTVPTQCPIGYHIIICSHDPITYSGCIED